MKRNIGLCNPIPTVVVLAETKQYYKTYNHGKRDVLKCIII